MKNLCIALLISILITSCEIQRQPIDNVPKVINIGDNYKLICIDKVVYIKYTDYDRFGIAPKYNRDGTIETCS